MAIICFFLCIQLVSLFSLYSLHCSYLIQCDHQNQIDLTCISHMKALAEHNSWVHRCKIDPSQLVLKRSFQIKDETFDLEDHTSYISCISRENKEVEMRLYYDDHGSIGIDYITLTNP